MPNPYIASASITPSGEWLWVVPLTGAGTSALGGIGDIAATGATITIDGVTTPLTDGVCNHMLEGFLYPLLPARVSLKVDDGDAGCVRVGTWNAVTLHAPHADGGSFRESTAPTDTATWTFSGLVPGRYRLSANLWDLGGPDRTTDALYAVKDGAGSTLGGFHRDLTRALYPTFDRARYGLALHDIGRVTLGAGQDTITVTLSNAAGSGLLFADALVLESDFVSPAQPGSTITASFPAGTVTVSGVATDAATDVPVSFETDETFCHPIHAAADRTLKVGYNLHGVREDWPSVYLADRSLGCDVWSGCAVDAHFEMTANDAGTAKRTVLYYPVGDRGLSPWGMYLADDGVFRFEFNVSGVTFDDAAKSAVGLASFNSGNAPEPPAPTFGAKTWTDLGGGRWRLEQSVTHPAWTPISGRASDFSPYWSQGVQFVVPVAGLVVTDWRWYDSRTPVGYTGTTHPDIVARYKGKIKVFRFMDQMGTNWSPAANPGDDTTLADRATPATGGALFPIATANCVAAHPVDFDPTTDPDQFHRWFTTNGYYGWFVLELDRDPVAAGFADGSMLSWDSAASFPSTVAGVTLNLHDNSHAFSVGANKLIVMCGVSTSYDTSGSTRATLAATQDLTGHTVSIYKNHLLPPELSFDIARECDAEPWVNFGHLGTDAYVDWLMDLAIAGTPDGRTIHGEYSNETWNAAFGQFTHFSIMMDHGNWLHGQDAVANPYAFATPSGWYAHRSLEIRDRCRARLTAAGRNPDLLVWHLGSLTQAPGVTDNLLAQVVAEGKTLDARDCLALEAYQDYKPPGGDYSGPSPSATWTRCTVDGMVDLLAAATFHGSRKAWADAHRSKLDAAGFAACKISGYETGWAYVAPDSDPMHVAEIMAHPRMHRITAAEQSSLQDAGYSIANKYADIYYSNVGADTAWTDFTSAVEPLGAGSPSENPNAVDYANIVSQPAGGRIAWAAGASFAATPTTPPPPPAVGPLIDAYEAAARARSDAKARLAAATAALSAAGGPA